VIGAAWWIPSSPATPGEINADNAAKARGRRIVRIDVES
jgi:hypothetical protein